MRDVETAWWDEFVTATSRLSTEAQLSSWPDGHLAHSSPLTWSGLPGAEYLGMFAAPMSLPFCW